MELFVYIDSELKCPIYEQIYNFIKNEIKSGRLKAGQILPSSRAMAVNLQISRSTVILAYDQLVAEGYIESIPRKGYCVMEIDKSFASAIKKEKLESTHILKPERKYDIVFSPDGIESRNFPMNEWRRISRQIFTEENAELFNSGNPMGDAGLRKQLSKYLLEARGVNAGYERIIIGAGYESLLQILNMIFDRQEIFAMENPAYIKSYSLIKKMGRKIVPVSMDEYGIKIDELEKSGANIAYVTPSHQYPLGIVMPIRRRMELLDWANREQNRYIIEDDYDSELRYKGKPIPSLQGSDAQDKVIYTGTFSKSISPAIRMGYMILPKSLFEAYMGIKFFGNTVSRIDQRLVEEFMAAGSFERHLNSMRKIYKNKHDVILAKIKGWRNTRVSGENAGAHILLTITNGMMEKELTKKAADAGIKVYPLLDYYIEASDLVKREPTIIIGYARLGEEEIVKGLEILKEQWKL